MANGASYFNFILDFAMLLDFKIRNVIIYYTLTIITLNKMFSGGDRALRL